MNQDTQITAAAERTVWKLSAGTACAVGRKRMKIDVLPTTAYVMLGEKCANTCRFCSQSARSRARADQLSRVTWPDFDGADAVTSIDAAYRQGRLKRTCLQVVRTADHWERTTGAVDALRRQSRVPLCVSSHLTMVSQACELVERGADRVCIALDAATPELYRTIKGGDWEPVWQLLGDCAAVLPGRISTHLIVGLGETEQEMIERLALCREIGVSTGLFAFTPVRGTEQEHCLPPALDHYRRVQLAHYLLNHGCPASRFVFTETGRLQTVALTAEQRQMLRDGEAFRTSGCPDCNRPYYNERPGGILYNYPRPLTPSEAAQALRDCWLEEEGFDAMASD
ncbi:MAG TPA: radical SAM protein [Patescibacteria group bacterium]|nr:radical SAM protein [Patescibacteria group bacterium]